MNMGADLRFDLFLSGQCPRIQEQAASVYSALCGIKSSVVIEIPAVFYGSPICQSSIVVQSTAVLQNSIIFEASVYGKALFVDQGSLAD